MAAAASDTLARVFAELRSRSDDVRLRAANDLRECVEATAAEVTGEPFVKFTNDIDRRIYELIHSPEPENKVGGILAIEELVDVLGEENTTKVTRFANYLRIVLPGADPLITVRATKALGRLAASGGSLTSEVVEFEAKRALEWLQATDRHEMRRYAAVLIIKELAQNAPTLIYSYVAPILDSVWSALRDPKTSIREGAGDALHECLDLIYQRETLMRQQLLKKVYEEAQRGFKLGTVEAVHGSLLALSQLLEDTGKLFLEGRYREIADTVLRNKDSKEFAIRKTVIQLLPQLAHFDTPEFIGLHLRSVAQFLLAPARKEKERALALYAIGRISLAVNGSIMPFLGEIIANLKESFQTKGKTKAAPEPQMFQCVSMLSKAIGSSLAKYMHEILDLMFSTGLSEPLRATLVDLGENLPSFLPIIQERFLNMICIVLSGQAYRHPGAPHRASGAIYLNETFDSETVLLALNVFGTFNFQGYFLVDVVKDSVSLYLEDSNADIRKACATCCSRVLAKDPISSQTTPGAMRTVGEILERLLTVAIADTETSIRHTVLLSMSDKFDKHLAQAENIRALFIALNDEVFAIRETAISIIGRLTAHNPAYVLPSLRRTLIQLLSELEYSTVSRNKEECARLLTHLISAAQRLIKPYAEPIFKVLLPKAKDASPGVASKILESLGALAKVGTDDLLPYLDQIFPLIIDTLHDQSSAIKRQAALRTLGQIASNTGCVIDPYIKYPNLLDILINILKTEQSVEVRHECVNVLGVLGALDPYKYKQISSKNTPNAIAADAKESATLSVGPSSDEYYPTVAIMSLMKILRDPSLNVHHTVVVQAIMYIFKTLGLKCVPFLPQIMPPFLNMMKSCPENLLDFYFQQLSDLVFVVKQHIRNYLKDLFALIQEYWSVNAGIQITILSLIESIAVAMDGEFKAYLPMLLPNILLILETDMTRERPATLKVLHVLVVFGVNLEEYMHLVLPFVSRIIERQDIPVAVRRSAITTLMRLCRRVNLYDQASRVVHPLVRVLSSAAAPPELKTPVMDTLSALIYQMESDFLVFIPTIRKIMVKNHVQNARYEILVAKLLRNEPLPKDQDLDPKPDDAPSETLAKKLPVNQQSLKRAWEASQRSTKEDWFEWIRRLSVELLKESPSHALRACATLASTYYPLARELFNAGFVSCWSELYDQFQDELVRSLKTALTSPTIPAEILQTILNLAEFMEHDDKALPIDIRTLGAYSAKCHAYAKALHYKEVEFISEPSLTNTIEALISINNQLQQPDSAIGILTYAQQNHDVELKESWYEKLQRWEDALFAYERKYADDPDSSELTLGKMRCLHALGEWDALARLAQDKWASSSEDLKRVIAPLAAAAYWGIGRWDTIEDYIGVMREDSPDGAFFRAIYNVHADNYTEALRFISVTRDLLDTELTALVGESYNRAYNIVVRVQMLAELEEIITYKQIDDFPDKQAILRKTWMRRLKGCQRNVEVWQRVLKIKALVIAPKDDQDMWIKFSNLCRKSGRNTLAYKTLGNLLNTDIKDFRFLDPNVNPPHVVYSILKLNWAYGARDESFAKMKEFTKNMCQKLGITSSSWAEPEELRDDSDPTRTPLFKLLARCYLKLGEWQSGLSENLTDGIIADVLKSYLAATNFDRSWYKAWHLWALANFEAISYYEKTHENNMPGQYVAAHVIPSVHGFFRSIALSHGNSLQDTLRLLTVWFKYGYVQEVNNAVSEGFSSVRIDTWLQVIPQLIARIHSPIASVRRLIHQLISEVGKEHPQALVYSLTVASKSQSVQRKKSALAIMEKMKVHSASLVEQALLVSQELIRVAILWHEMWHEGLEEASRLYFGDQNVEGMFATLEPLHQVLERGPETMREISFNQAFGRDLHEAQDWCRKYKRTLNVNDLNQAWDCYYHVFRRINKQLPQLTTLELQYVSPRLLNAKDLDLAVPGSYKSGEEVVKISFFAPTLSVITSKQRPRKLSIRGSNGKDYQYLLKGHEDLRQDERVMQLFGLVNTLLGADAETFKRHLSIQRYPVIPLSPNSGLIGWVPDCDTLHALIRDYRDSRKILLNIEHRLMLQMAPDYDHLTLLQKVEVFEYALENTTGQDLYKVLWLKSKNSEVWLDRRTNYTRSLAVMSMVGYVLGLGDRHPSNLMLDRFSGRVIHIDFGDCFEVAMHREKFPERIPFRLTRMLINAMEVSGIEGNFRITCENVMRVLRENKDSLMAVLEAFVYDPLINWRLMGGLSPNKQGEAHADKAGGNKNFPAARKLQKNENDLIAQDEDNANKPEVLNSRAVAVINRVQNKLTGRDFKANTVLDVPSQVQKLILQATSLENLSLCYVGWCAFW